MSNTFEFEATAATKAAAAIDTLVNRLSSEIAAVAPTLSVPPAGADEVSARAATTTNAVADDFLTKTESGVHEMRKLAASLRGQVAEFGKMEADNASGLGS
ncbi:PE family protein [Nocardia camponoti]|uniref:PE domain-containing protein n=1 Tax=Nocardia camponoti TaxID=1616106 RepID=A0A917VAI3_9NOCA|nr:PE family protein [Nocardia camponoti]GGK57510.1 hypothetical protein GCM10011591_32080 [Nocardia camponoti]